MIDKKASERFQMTKKNQHTVELNKLDIYGKEVVNTEDGLIGSLKNAVLSINLGFIGLLFLVFFVPKIKKR